MKTKFGHMPCPDCSQRVVVTKNEHDTLSYSCQECFGNGVAKKEQGARYANWLNSITPVAAPKPAPADPQPGKPAKQKSEFDI